MKTVPDMIVRGLSTLIIGCTFLAAQADHEHTTVITVTQTATRTQTVLAIGGTLHRLVIPMDAGNGLTSTTTVDFLTATQLVTLETRPGMACPTVTAYVEREEDLKRNNLVRLMPHADDTDDEKLLEDLLKFAALPHKN